MNLERDIESYLTSRVAALGGVAEKTISPSGRGYFDRVIVLPAGRVAFVELKRPRGGRTTVHQRERHQRYEALGAIVAICKTCADVDRLMERLCGPDAGAPLE
jgi:hypothetical protein